MSKPLAVGDAERVGDRRHRAIYWAGVGLGIAAVAAIPAGLAWVFLHPPRRLHGRNPATGLGLPYERLRLQTEDGVWISGWYVPAPAESSQRGVVVLCHGYTGNRTTMLPYLDILHRAGYPAVLFDFRAHGWSGGRKSTFGHREPLDLEAILNWVEARPELSDQPIALLGESMGAAVSLIVAAAEPRVRAVVADSPYARFDAAVKSRLRLALGPIVAPIVLPHMMRAGEKMLGVRAEEIAPEEAVIRIAPRPVLLIHGLDDPLLTPENSHRIRDAAPGSVSLWEVEDSRHCKAIYNAPEEYARQVTEFLAGAL